MCRHFHDAQDDSGLDHDVRAYVRSSQSELLSDEHGGAATGPAALADGGGGPQRDPPVALCPLAGAGDLPGENPRLLAEHRVGIGLIQPAS